SGRFLVFIQRAGEASLIALNVELSTLNPVRGAVLNDGFSADDADERSKVVNHRDKALVDGAPKQFFDLRVDMDSPVVAPPRYLAKARVCRHITGLAAGVEQVPQRITLR
ncbi:MAG TPA: hypothetical protein VGF76_02435, partial [Polyangiaceae bacterium]